MAKRTRPYTIAEIDMTKVSPLIVVRLRNRIQALEDCLERLTERNSKLSISSWIEDATREKQRQEAAQARAVTGAQELLTHFYTEDQCQLVGRHLGLLVVTYTGEVSFGNQGPRALWLIEWLLGYLVGQGFSVADLARDHGRAAIEALMTVAAQEHDLQVNVRRQLPEEWRRVNRFACDFVYTLLRIAGC